MDRNKKIYLKQETIRLGFGSTSRNTVIENYFQVEEAVEGNMVSIRLLNINDQPFGELHQAADRAAGRYDRDHRWGPLHQWKDRPKAGAGPTGIVDAGS